MFDRMSYLNRIKSSIIHLNNKLTIGDIISNLNSKIPWDKNSYNFITYNYKVMIANIIKILQAELDIINKDYDLNDIPPVILRTFRNVTEERIKKNLPIKENNILKDSKSIYLVFK